MAARQKSLPHLAAGKFSRGSTECQCSRPISSAGAHRAGSGSVLGSTSIGQRALEGLLAKEEANGWLQFFHIIFDRS